MNEDDLTALGNLQTSVDGLRKDLRSERETRTWQGLAVVALIVVGGVINGLLLLKVSDQADELAGNRVADCERSNASRAALLDVTDALPNAIFTALVAVTDDEERTPEQQTRLDGLVTEAVRIAAENTAPQRAALAPRDCSHEAVNP